MTLEAHIVVDYICLFLETILPTCNIFCFFMEIVIFTEKILAK